jgi:hypothetical protein
MVKKLVLILLLIPFGLSLNAQESKPLKVNLLTGDVYKVELPSHKSTNHQWFYEPVFDTTMLVFQGYEFIAPVDKANTKDEGKDVFTFKALKKGECRVRFALKAQYGRDIARIEDFWFIIGKK